MRSCMRGLRRARRPAMPAGFVLAVLAGTLVLAGSSGLASAESTAAGTGQAFPLGSSWTYTSSTPSGSWFAPGFDTSGWTTGNAPFSDTAPGAPTYCGFPTASSPFALDSTIYLRHSFSLPANAFGLHVVGTIDNDAHTYVNGTDEGVVDSGNCVPNAIDLDVPNSNLTRGASKPDLVAVQASDYGYATYFDMQATYGTIDFAQQPSEVQKGAAISPAPTVTITGPDGSPVAGATVSMTLQQVAGSGTLSGDTSETTNASGVATFSSLSVSDGGEYALVATSEGATVTSDPFVVADQITPCTGSCSSTGSSSGTTVEADAKNAGGSLAVSVYSGPPPSGVCDNAAPLGASAIVNFLDPGSSTPNLNVIWTLDKSLVQQAPNPGAAHFDICLGAENLQHPDGSGVTPWTTKDGTPATPVADPVLGVTLFWGLVPDCPNKGQSTGPCIKDRDKHKGNEVITVYKPYPWDGRMYGA